MNRLEAGESRVSKPFSLFDDRVRVGLKVSGVVPIPPVERARRLPALARPQF